MHGGIELLREVNEMEEMDRKKCVGNFDLGHRPSIAPEGGKKVRKASGSAKHSGGNASHQARTGSEDGDAHCA